MLEFAIGPLDEDDEKQVELETKLITILGTEYENYNHRTSRSSKRTISTEHWHFDKTRPKFYFYPPYNGVNKHKVVKILN